jgi:hypothetical protein
MRENAHSHFVAKSRANVLTFDAMLAHCLPERKVSNCMLRAQREDPASRSVDVEAVFLSNARVKQQ